MLLRPYKRNDDEEDDEPCSPGKGQEGSLANLLQRKFLKLRKLFLWGAVTEDSAKDMTEKLLYLDWDAPGKPITFYINSPGGSVDYGMSIYDTMQLIKSPITVVVTGMAASMGSVLLCGAKKGRRLLYPNASVLIHQPLISGHFTGPAVDIHIRAKEMERIKEEINKILAKASGQPLERIQKDTDRDFYMTAKEALEYGLADKIVEEV